MSLLQLSHLKQRLTKLRVKALQLADQQLRPLTPRAATDRLQTRLGPEGIAQLVADYQAGADTTELVTRYGIGKGSVIRILQDHQVVTCRQSPTDEQPRQAVRLYEQGDSLTGVGRQLGFDTRTIHRLLHREGVRMRDSHGRAR